MKHLEAAEVALDIGKSLMARVKVWIWDEIGGDWISEFIDLPDNASANDINLALMKAQGDLDFPEDEGDKQWTVKKEHKIENARVIESWSDTGHVSFLVVGAKNAKDAERLTKAAGYEDELF